MRPDLRDVVGFPKAMLFPVGDTNLCRISRTDIHRSYFHAFYVWTWPIFCRLSKSFKRIFCTLYYPVLDLYWFVSFSGGLPGAAGRLGFASLSSFFPQILHGACFLRFEQMLPATPTCVIYQGEDCRFQLCRTMSRA